MHGSAMHFLGFFVLLSMALLGCPGDDDGTLYHPSCQAIIDVCHEAEEMFPSRTDLVECHDYGHDNDMATCDANQTRCVGLCQAALADGGGGGSDGGSIDGGSTDGGDTDHDH
jgi:hypothetical protein